ncbi:SIR2 family protein [Pectobacterium brasiliense]|uniref:SIR2 family protein n=1 Tax=Pectobacterium brasiliense TaxID=180957 RepID=A0AAW9H7T3_9GAMM|nr:SIR2 family protein [Pectobacterium brasiliense]MDY4380036.1 SIR2 family protein [Pectobacterium brasiliense]
MRFLANGPSIPDDLLLARDQGRVIFFCGAGVSRAYAKLPDFFGLASKVISKLGVDKNSPAYKLIQEAQEFDRRVGIPGIISADRVFGLLERDFSSHDIEEAVAYALKPPTGCDLTAHRILLDLATTPAGTAQLVTTNFDRLFDDCGRKLQVWQPPRLPDPLRPNEINGVVYLHGRATPTYTGAEGDGFVLSSSEFGRAYLSDGWATTFIREILGKYVVVFVGYTADDPPVQYLLEALRRASENHENAYAFQSGDHDDAVARWRHKGVKAIPYSPDNAHAALWQSLEAWAERARDPDAWYEKIIGASKKGPTALQPHERGQVAHVISTYEGVKKFCIGEIPPSAEWLCVFDKHRRFAKPGSSGSLDCEEPYIDPFDLYGLDSDTPPPKSDPEDHYAKRETPSDAWDAFELNRLDRASIHDENLPALRGYWANHSPRLVPRIEQLGIWLAKVCDQPATVWWAAHQKSLHQSIQEHILWEIERDNRLIHQDIRNAWRSLFEAWEYVENVHRDWYSLKAAIKAEGWSSVVVRRFGEVLRPRFSAEPDFLGGPKPPESEASKEDCGYLLQMDVKYPETQETITVPDEWCSAAVKVLRQNLELALTLEHEIGSYGLSNISPIVQDNIEGTDDYHRTHGLSAAVIQFTELFSHLIKADKSAAKHEFLSWPIDDDTIFARLRIWASGKRSIVSDGGFGQFITSLSNSAFWDSYHQRDLLLVIAERWKKLSSTSRKLIEQKLLSGPTRRKSEKIAVFESRRAWSILNRIQWLQNAGCKLSSATNKQAKLLRTVVPDWREDYGAKAADSKEGRSGFVRTNTSHEVLLDIPLSRILLQAKKHSSRSEDFLVKNAPFAGLSVQRPVRAFAVLTYAAKQGSFPEWAWQQFLSSEARKNDKPRLVHLIAERLTRYQNEQLVTILDPVTNWLRDVSTKLNTECLPIFDLILTKLVSVLRESPNGGRSAIIRGSNKPDWAMEAINSPTGKIAQVLFNDPRQNNLYPNQGLPSKWLAHTEALLALPDDLRRYSLVIFFHNLNWFFTIDPKWTEQHLLPVLQGNNTDDRDSVWSGFLWGAKTPNIELYMRLKNDMLEFATNPLPSRSSYGEIIVGMILAGWGTVNDATGERCISNDEMRSLLLTVDDEFRSRVLWQAQRWSKNQNENSHKRWEGLLSELLQIWPRQLSARSPNTSARLCELAFSSGEQFPTLAALVLPLLSRIERDHLMLPELRRPESNIIDQYPEQALALLYTILQDNALAWPYGIEGILQKIGEADSSLNSDERLISLKRRWDAR